MNTIINAMTSTRSGTQVSRGSWLVFIGSLLMRFLLYVYGGSRPGPSVLSSASTATGKHQDLLALPTLTCSLLVVNAA
jgi:hypothetical protein